MSLQIIARVMRDTVDLMPVAWIKRDLPRGLQLCLSHKEEEYRLSIAREGVYPSPEEIAICARTFGVPEGSEHQLFKTTTYHPKTKRKVQICVAALTWRELPAVTERAMRAA